jgi:hypothetical protein
MKTKYIILFLLIIALNSCIVKSLHPFYTDNTIFFEKLFVGNWTSITGSDHTWNVNSWETAVLEYYHKTSVNQLSKKELEDYNEHKNSYYVKYTENGKEAFFIAVPFKIENQLFLDFSVFDVDLKSINDLYGYHLIGTHSLVKFDILNNNRIDLKWFAEEKLKNLLDETKIKINYEKLGKNDSAYLLTASSEELQKFLKKYLKSKDKNKWEATENQVSFQLKRTDG